MLVNPGIFRDTPTSLALCHSIEIITEGAVYLAVCVEYHIRQEGGEDIQCSKGLHHCAQHQTPK